MKKYLVFLVLIFGFFTNVNAQEWAFARIIRPQMTVSSSSARELSTDLIFIKNDDNYSVITRGVNQSCDRSAVIKNINFDEFFLYIEIDTKLKNICNGRRFFIQLDGKSGYEEIFSNNEWIRNNSVLNIKLSSGPKIETLIADLKINPPNISLASTKESENYQFFRDQEVAQQKLLAEIDAKKQQQQQQQQKQALEAQQKEQARLVQDAKQKEQERLIADQKVKEQLRIAEETARSKDLELAKLKEELVRAQEQNAKQKLVTSNRRAFVVGNDSYKQVNKLLNSREDARTIADNLSRVGYTVTTKLDMTEREMRTAWRIFKSQIQPGDEIAFFYAGHGVQLGNTNYLLPVDVSNENEDQIKDEGMTLQRILDDLSERKARFSIAMIDACRDNPFSNTGRNIGGTSRGLAPTTAATGQMIIFSAGAGQQALDRLGPQDKNKNGVFTRIFVKEMLKPGISVDRVVRNVRNEVVELARSIGHEQVPAIYDQVVGEFYFSK